MIPNLLNKRKCNRVCKLLSEYIDGCLNPRKAAFIEEHLANCSACRSEYESLKQTVGLLAQVKPVTAPRSFAVTAVRAIPYPSFFRPLRIASVTFAIMLAVVFTGDVTNILPELSTNEITSSPLPVASATLSSVPPEGDVVTKVSEGASVSGVSAGEPLKVGEDGPAPQGIQEDTKTSDSSSDLISDSSSPVSPEITEELWWLRSLELILLVVFAITGVTTVFIWRKYKRIYS